MDATKNTNGLGLVWVTVKDMDDAIKFYTETVGLELKERHDEFKWAELGGDMGAGLGLAEYTEGVDNAGGMPGSNAIMCISVQDIDAACEHFKAKGAELVGEIMEVPGHVKLQTVRDPAGNILQLAEKL